MNFKILWSKKLEELKRERGKYIIIIRDFNILSNDKTLDRVSVKIQKTEQHILTTWPDIYLQNTLPKKAKKAAHTLFSIGHATCHQDKPYVGL